MPTTTLYDTIYERQKAGDPIWKGYGHSNHGVHLVPWLVNWCGMRLLDTGTVTVIDLGCGTGRDAYVIAQLVGPNGQVHGVDMTEEQLAVARQTESWHADRFRYARQNTHFHHGFMEDLESLGIAPGKVGEVRVCHRLEHLVVHRVSRRA